MEKHNDILFKLIKSSSDLSKKLHTELDEVYPICFYCSDEEYKSFSIADWEGTAKEYGEELERKMSSK
ncbi:MAG: hypothetical protein HRT73_11675 [Flavobacteriales bacterium]|nr:hypothetical protein [Flavobacteriales bacterium]